MYSDANWNYIQGQQYRKHSAGRSTQSATADQKGRRSSEKSEDKNGRDKEGICELVKRSRVLGPKKEEAREQLPQDTLSASSSMSSPIQIVESSNLLLLDSSPANTVLPTFDQLCKLPPAIQCLKFFEDLRPLDRILVRVVRPGVAVLHVELVCMLTRFRRTLLPFMKGKLIPVAFDRTKRFYQVNDYISTTVVSIAPNSLELELQIDEHEAILTQQGIPAYCRDFGREVAAISSFDDDPSISSLRDNPSLAAQLEVRINSVYSALPALRNKRLELAPGPEELRKEQTSKLAMSHVAKGAELTRENKCFEAIQCFNKALSVDQDCADAYVGRGAACAGNRNFPGALQDLEKAIGLQPAHRNANKYRMEVLLAYGRDLERSGELDLAREQFQRIMALCTADGAGYREAACEALDRLNRVQRTEVIELDGEDDEEEEGRRDGFDASRNRKELSEEEVRRNREKLAEMEEFIRKLKSKN